MVGLGGLEPPTSRLSSARSNQLSYKPDLSGRRAEDRRRKTFPSSDARHPSSEEKERRRRRNPAKRGFDKAALI
jgi:hypothetical protein